MLIRPQCIPKICYILGIHCGLTKYYIPQIDLQIERPDQSNVSFFNVSHVVETITVAFQKRSDGRRTKVLLTLFIVFILYGPTICEYFNIFRFMHSYLMSVEPSAGFNPFHKKGKNLLQQNPSIKQNNS